MSAFRPKQAGVKVISRKKIKAARRLQNAYGVQKSEAAKKVQERAEALLATRGTWTVDEPVLEGRVWRCSIRKQEPGGLSVSECEHNHKSPETARGCAEREAKRKNKEETNWTEEKVADLVKEVTAKR